MASSKLILIAGIPGSGKTTTARFVYDCLKLHGLNPVLFQEGDWNHPTDFESVACLNQSEFADIQAKFPEQAGLLAQNGLKERSEWFFSYRKMQAELGDRLPEELYKTLESFDIYNLPARKFQRLLLRHWKKFIERAAAEDRVYVFECSFFQNPITTLLARHNLNSEAIQQYVLALSESLKALKPKLIYFAPENPGAVLENVRRERPHEWADFVTEYLTGQAYGLAHGLHGFDGVIQFYIIRQALELACLPTLSMPSITLPDFMDWGQRHEYIESFLEL